MKRNDIIQNELNYFAHYPKIFTVNEVVHYIDSTIEPQLIKDSLLADPRFLHIADNLVTSELFLSKDIIIDWLVYSSIKLAKAKKSRITASQLQTMMSSLGFVRKTVINTPEEIVSFGQSFGLIGHTYNRGEYFFPIAHLISFIKPYPIKALFNLIKASLEKVEVPTEKVVMENVKSALSKLGPRESYVLIRRESFQSKGSKTLQEIADELDCTRERVRQIEKTAQSCRSIIKPLLMVLLRDIVDRRGYLIYESSKKTAIIIFIAKYLKIPYLNLKEIGLHILGSSDIRLQKISCPLKITDYTNLADWLDSEFELTLLEGDVFALAACLTKWLEEKLTIAQKLYLTLQDIGKPAHYSTITKHYNFLFPEWSCTEQSVHSTLVRETYGVVWIGAKGIYALSEWGYERPSKSLFNTVKEIVEAQYKERGKPVPLNVIISELGKYRKFINPASGLMAIFLNPDVEQISPKSFIPKRFSLTQENKDEATRLDKLLTEFENQLQSIQRSKL